MAQNWTNRRHDNDEIGGSRIMKVSKGSSKAEKKERLTSAESQVEKDIKDGGRRSLTNNKETEPNQGKTKNSKGYGVKQRRKKERGSIVKLQNYK